VRLDEVRDLCYITPISNISSILQRGILSHSAVRQLQHESVANANVQQRRALRTVSLPNGTSRSLHSYVNLYFCARNPMMYCLQSRHCELCVITVSPDSLHANGVVIADGNAAARLTRFYASPGGLAGIDAELVYARSWDHADPVEKDRRKKIKCAEVLVPDRVVVGLFTGIVVSRDESSEVVSRLLSEAGVNLPVEVSPDVFFH